MRRPLSRVKVASGPSPRRSMPEPPVMFWLLFDPLETPATPGFCPPEKFCGTLRITSPRSEKPSCWICSLPIVLTGDGVLPPRMRVPVTVTACRLVTAGGEDLSGDFFGCVFAGALVTGALPCVTVFVVVSWAMAHSPAPMAATSKAMEMALHSVRVFITLLSPWLALLTCRSGRAPELARSSGKSFHLWLAQVAAIPPTETPIATSSASRSGAMRVAPLPPRGHHQCQWSSAAALGYDCHAAWPWCRILQAPTHRPGPYA